MKSQGAGPFDGWITKYKVNRPVYGYEAKARLDPKKTVKLPPIVNGVSKLNSVFIECVDRFFYLRGYAVMGGLPIAILTMWASVMLMMLVNEPLYSGEKPPGEVAAVVLFFSFVFFSIFVWLLKFVLFREFFCYTHYPIRFNRINRKIYVFRHNGEGGVLDLEWDKVYWFVGRSRDGSDISYDLRCHILDAEGIVRETFAVGHFSSTRAETLQHWEMIRRYMEESPAVLPFPPLALVLSTEPTWRNCITIQVGGASGHSPLFMLLTVPWAFFRWISQITCRRPRWPDEVEAECQIPIDDPYRLPEPASSGEVVGLDEVAEAALFEYRKKAEAAALAYEAVYSVQGTSN